MESRGVSTGHPAASGPRPLPKTCVVVSYWAGRPPKNLHRLLGQMQKVDAGARFDLTVVCNGGDARPLSLPGRFGDLGPRIYDRENSGFNIAAWDHGWRKSEGYQYYLFLQDDCYLKSVAWVSRFESRIEGDRGIGLLGEMVAHDRMSWDYVRQSTYERFWGPRSGWPEPEHPIDFYRERFEDRGIPWVESGAHLPSVILFASRQVLGEIDGFPFFGPSYRDAVTSEMAISRLVEMRGYRFSKVTDYPFELIGHPEWASNGKIRQSGFRSFLRECYWKSKAQIRRSLGLSRAVKPPSWARSEGLQKA